MTALTDLATGAVTLNLSYATGTIGVYVDGVLLKQAPAVNGVMTFKSASTLAPGIHSVVVQAVSEGETINTINFQ